MKKMPCLFVREFHGRNSFTITQEVTSGCEWVIRGEGSASRKWDGTAAMVMDAELYARYDAKAGKTPPPGAIPCCPEPDSVTGHWPHWVLATRPEDKWIREAAEFTSKAMGPLPNGTYEACGPKISKSETFAHHILLPHGGQQIHNCPRTFEGLRDFLGEYDGEGIVFANTDGAMCKIRRDDFGFDWPRKAQ